MFEQLTHPESGAIAPAAVDLGDWLELLGNVDGGHTDADCVDQLNALERLKSAAAAAQVRVTGALESFSAGRPHTGTDAGLGMEVGFARQESPHQGRTHLGLSRALLHDLPHTLAALARGDISERRAQIIATETSDLTHADRLLVDAETGGLSNTLGDLKLQQAVRRVVLRIDEAAVVRRRTRAHTQRHVSGRLLTDGMAQVTGIVSDLHYAMIMNSLSEAAAKARAAGDDRSRSQVIADLFVTRLTGQITAQAAPIAVKLVVSAETLLGHGSEPAHVPGAGFIPASIARQLVAASDAVRTTIQRLFHFPETGVLVAMEREVRAFPADLKAFIDIRDHQLCRTPWCNSPVRHFDHADPVHNGGHTSSHNGQGLCEACNYAKESPGWRQRPTSEGFEAHTIQITTPTGHLHQSRAPDLPVPPQSQQPRPATRLEAQFFDIVLAC